MSWDCVCTNTASKPHLFVLCNYGSYVFSLSMIFALGIGMAFCEQD